MSENQPTLGQPPAAPRKGMSTGVIVLIVLGVCGFCLIPILAAIAIPAFLSFTRRAKATEARSNISAITRMLQHYAMTQPAGANGSSPVRLPASIPRTPAEPPCVPHAWTAIELAAWSRLGYAPDLPLRYSYEVVTSSDGMHATVRALGDLDCDHRYASFEQDVALGPDGSLLPHSELRVVDETE